MEGATWVNEVAELPADKRGCYVSVWTGYRYEYWAGPFADERDARHAVEYWEEHHGITRGQPFKFENLDGQK